MVRIFKVLLFLLALALLAFVGLLAFAYLGDMSPERGEITQPVTLDVD